MERGQTKLSFGMIFSIILIIVFLGFAFFSVKKFIGVSESAQVTQFRNNFQSDINKIWAASQGSQNEEYSIPKKIEKICFLDVGADASGPDASYYSTLNFYSTNNQNLFFYPPTSSPGFESVKMEHIDIGAITTIENPYCITSNGKVSMVLDKNFNEILVKINRKNGN